MDNHLRTGFDMQWRTISDPIGHGRWLCDKASCFAKQIPQQMNFDSFKSGCKGAATSLFPKTTHALTTKKENLDDYSRAYIHQQAALELATFLASFVLAEATTAERLAVSQGELLASRLSKAEELSHTKEAVYSSRRSSHVFREAPGHVEPNTKASRERYIHLFEKVASRPENAKSPLLLDINQRNAGLELSAKIYRNGREVWVHTRDGKIQNAGVNIEPWYPD